MIACYLQQFTIKFILSAISPTEVSQMYGFMVNSVETCMSSCI